MTAIDQLKSVLCDPEGKCCIAGSDEDRAIIDRALDALAQPEEPTDLHNRLADLHFYEEIAEHYAKCAISPEALRDWVAERVNAQPEERNFCPRCGKRTADLTAIHTCTPPKENT